MPREKVIATVVWLLENTLIRIGNEEYEKENKSYGLTTLKNKHVETEGNTIKFQFKGKSGVYHDVEVKNKRVAKIINTCQDLPGQDLFEYIDDEGKVQRISSQDVNEYLKQITNKDISAKDFRTWGGTIIAANLLSHVGTEEDEKAKKTKTVEVVKKVAKHLRNKPDTCRKYYIHPTILEGYSKGYTITTIRTQPKYKLQKKLQELDECENDVLCMLKVLMNT